MAYADWLLTQPVERIEFYGRGQWIEIVPPGDDRGWQGYWCDTDGNGSYVGTSGGHETKGDLMDQLIRDLRYSWEVGFP